MIELMLPALVAALLLVGIHGYLGIHIIARGVIFVDLALAQVAAMGWAAAGLGLADPVASFLGIGTGTASYLLGVGATLVAAALFAVSRFEGANVDQEAIIGIVYVVASAITILLAAQAPRGSEHVQELLTGTLLWVGWDKILEIAVLYALIGLVHWWLRDRFLTISLDPDEARRQGWSFTGWDFLFYALFGLVVTSSVEVAGVLLVFSFLVIPAVIAFLFTARPGPLLGIAWSVGTLATVAGLIASYRTDLPTGPVVVCAFGAALVIAFVVRIVTGAKAEGELAA
jgi:zinc/manganese transport system permease protein